MADEALSGRAWRRFHEIDGNPDGGDQRLPLPPPGGHLCPPGHARHRSQPNPRGARLSPTTPSSTSNRRTKCTGFFPNIPGACEITSEIAARCHVLFDTDRASLAEISGAGWAHSREFSGRNSREMASTTDWPTLRQRRHSREDDYRARLETELEIINKMGFPGYFLVVWDFIRSCQEHGHSGGSRTGLGGRLGRLVCPGNHRHRSTRVRPALRDGF